MLLGAFRMTAGSVPGTDHTKPDQPGFLNNQDAYAIRYTDHSVVGIVCDGCGSGGNSEVGSRIGAATFSTALSEMISGGIDEATIRQYLLAAQTHTLKTIRYVADSLVSYDSLSSQPDPAFIAVMCEYMLFTVVGFVITPTMTYTFTIGDGVISMNDEVTIIDPMEGNRPVYLSYAITGSTITDAAPELLDAKIHHAIPTSDVRSIVIGTDGCVDIINRSEDMMPGNGVVGPLKQFTEENMFIARDTNGVMLITPKAQRRLNLMNESKYRVGESGEMVRRHGVLHDDTTLIAVRRM